MSVTRRTKILALGLGIAFLTACSTGNVMPPKPTKPSLNVVETNGLVCFPRADASALAGYIIDLEAGYD